MVRLFVALLLPDEIKSAMGKFIAELKPLSVGVKWVETENLHLTLKFIGETSEKNVASISETIGKAISGSARFDVHIAECGGFPNLRNAKVLWVGMNGADPAAEMAIQIEQSLVPLGIPAENRPFAPHLTVGRIKLKINLNALAEKMENAHFDAGTVTLDRVALVKSTLTPRGPIYENLKVYQLA